MVKKHSKLENILFWNDLLLSNKKYNNIEIIQDGGWHFTNIKSAEEIHTK